MGIREKYLLIEENMAEYRKSKEYNNFRTYRIVFTVVRIMTGWRKNKANIIKKEKIMNLTLEMLNAAKNAKTAEELILLAKENNIEATAEEIKAYFEQTHTTGELADDELDNVAGGCGGGGDSGPKEYIFPPRTYTHGGQVGSGPKGCGYYTANYSCPSSGNGFRGTIYFDSKEKWYIICNTCGGRFDGTGDPLDHGIGPM